MQLGEFDKSKASVKKTYKYALAMSDILVFKLLAALAIIEIIESKAGLFMFRLLPAK